MARSSTSIVVITTCIFFLFVLLVSFIQSNTNNNATTITASTDDNSKISWPLFDTVRVLSSVNGITASTLATPVFVPNGGSAADDSTTVTVTATPSNATICVTTDGKTQPKCSATKDTCVAGTKYTTPLKKTASSNGVTWFAVACAPQSNDSVIAVTLPWCTPFTKTNYTDATIDTEILKLLTKKTDDVSTYTAAQRATFFAAVTNTVIMASPRRTEIIAKSVPYDGTKPLNIGRKDAAPVMQLLNLGPGVTTSIVAISNLSSAVTELNVSSFATAKDIVTDVVKVERFDANNQNLNNVAFTFRMYAPGVSKLQVLTADRGSSTFKDIVADGGVVTDDSAASGAGWWVVTAKHTSSFVGMKGANDDSGLPTWAIVLIVIGSIVLAVVLIAIIIFLLRGGSKASSEEKVGDQYKAML